MAIKVVRRGTPPSEIVYAHTCSKCYSALEFNAGDAPIRGDQRDMAHVLTCPVCHNDNWISVLKKKVSNIDPY
jgi:hypothetical protein